MWPRNNGCIYALKTQVLIKQKDTLTIETLVGNLPIKINAVSNDDIQITMKQASPQFLPHLVKLGAIRY